MHNFLINNINRKMAEALPYKGLVIDIGCGTSPYKKYILIIFKPNLKFYELLHNEDF